MLEQEFVKIADVSEVAPGEMTVVRLGRDQVLLANIDGAFYAINNMCTHMMGRLGKGWLDGVEVICPFHSARFSVVTGQALTPPATESAQSYEVRVSGEEVQIRFDTD